MNNEFVPSQYQDVKEGDSINLVTCVNEILAHQGHQNPTLWTSDLHADALVLTTPPEFVRHLVNRALRMRLGDLPEDTTVQRGFLINHGPDFAWVGLFARGIAPTMTRNGI